MHSQLSKKIFFTLILVALCLYIVGFLSSYPYLLEFNKTSSSKLDTIRNIIEYSVMFLSFLVFCMIFLTKNIFTKMLGSILILTITLNFMISASCFFIYKQGFNVGMMMSILETNTSESLSMIKTLVYPLVASITFFLILYYIFIGGNNFLKGKKHPNLWKIFAFIWLVLPFIFYIKHKYINNKGGGFMIKNIAYHFMDLDAALKLKEQIIGIQNNKISYNFINTENEPTENIIILIGESARKNNLSLYGYKRETTPFANREKKNMLLYKNAHSPAAITNLAVPIILSNIDINNYSNNITNLSDNVLNVANQLGYETYWFSTQGYANGITAIASFAKNKKWLNGFDSVLIPELKTALKKTIKKKLIVLHINGSHPYSCDKYPQNEAFWKGGIDECYDNSIRYTDKIMGQIFQELRNTPSVIIYLSDHGQIKIDGKYIHGDYREAQQVPYFIWYSDKINSDKKGKEIVETTATTTLYANVLNLMGVKNPKTINNSEKFLKLDLRSIDYKDLK